MRTTFDAGQLKLLALVNEVQDINLDDLDIQGKQIDWPQICVVGGQAEGSKCFSTFARFSTISLNKKASPSETPPGGGCEHSSGR